MSQLIAKTKPIQTLCAEEHVKNISYLRKKYLLKLARLERA